jgi:putative FmdB family regulatory protein
VPTYPYVCTSCNKEFEVEQRITAEPLTTCEACGQPALKRQIAGTSFVLKGQHWYKDGYSSNVKCEGNCKGCEK